MPCKLVRVISTSYKSIPHLHTEQGQSLDKDRILEITVIPRQLDDLPNEQVDDRLSKACNSGADVPHEGTGGEEDYG